MQKSHNVLWTWRQNLLFYFLAKKTKTKHANQPAQTRPFLHVRTTVEMLETICIVYLDSNKQRHVSVCAAKLLLQASPSSHPH